LMPLAFGPIARPLEEAVYLVCPAMSFFFRHGCTFFIIGLCTEISLILFLCIYIKTSMYSKRSTNNQTESILRNELGPAGEEKRRKAGKKDKGEKKNDSKCSLLIMSFGVESASELGYEGHRSFPGDGGWRVTGAIASL
ncbi:hypothetical protein ALC56_13502, partial [Trachymyrmex septentrionalis]